MKLPITALIAAILFAASAYVKAAESKSDKDAQACDKVGEAAGDEAVKKVTVKHPLDVVKVKAKAKQDAFNACLAARAHSGGKDRAK
jgi:hypothetical protein